MENQTNKIEGFEGMFLHPSLDIKNDILILGFRFISKNKEEENFFLIVKEGEIPEIFRDDTIKYQGEEYYIEKRGRKLAHIEERWGINEVNEFIKSCQTRGIITLKKAREVFDGIKELLKKYTELKNEDDYLLITAWILGTYFFPIFSAYPFLFVKGPKGSGKSQLLSFLKQVCFNAIKARPSLASLGDTADSLRATYIMDQAESLKRKESEELLDIFTDSYKKSGGKRRIINFDKNKGREILEFETYSPKAFASVGELPEDLIDRCIVIPLFKSGKNFDEPGEESEKWKEKRGKIYQIQIDNFHLVKLFYEQGKREYKEKKTMVGRELELWLPLQVVLKICGKENEIRNVKKRFKALYGFSEWEPSEFEESVIRCILNQFNEKMEIILSPKCISQRMPDGLFLVKDNSRQRASKIGRVIKKLNLSAEKKPRGKDGVRYLFKKQEVVKINNIYFKTPESPTLPTLTPENQQNTEQNPIK